MNHRFVDLHVHTNYSDGVFSPAEAVRYAAKAGLSSISITDHDIVDGIPEAVEEGAKVGVEIIPGLELSTEVALAAERSEMHILGYCINWENRQLQESLALFRTTRQKRAHKILEKLESLGIKLDRDRLFSESGKGSIGRLHFAKAMVAEGFAGNIFEAFNRYLGIGKPAYVPKLRISPEEGIKMIIRAGGIPVLAHPYYGHYSNKNLLRGLVRDGLRGIEVWHSKHPPETVELFTKIAVELGLIATGGSDCHGDFSGEGPVMGNVKVPYSVVENLKKCKEEIDRANASIFIEPGGTSAH